MGWIELVAGMVVGGVIVHLAIKAALRDEPKLAEIVAAQKKTNDLLEAVAVRVQRMELLVYQMSKAESPENE